VSQVHRVVCTSVDNID